MASLVHHSVLLFIRGIALDQAARSDTMERGHWTAREGEQTAIAYAAGIH